MACHSLGSGIVDNLLTRFSAYRQESSNTSAKLFLKLGNVSRESLTRSVAPQWFSPSRYSRWAVYVQALE